MTESAVNYFNLDYVNKEFKFNNIYSTAINLAEEISLVELISLENQVTERTAFAKKKVIKYNLSKNESIKRIANEAIKQLEQDDKTSNYEINFKIRSCSLSYSLNKDEPIKNVMLKGIVNNENQNIWIDIILCN